MNIDAAVQSLMLPSPQCRGTSCRCTTNQAIMRVRRTRYLAAAGQVVRRSASGKLRKMANSYMLLHIDMANLEAKLKNRGRHEL